MATIQKIKELLEAANILGRANLANKGVPVDGTENTLQIMQKIGNISASDFWDEFQENGNRKDYRNAFQWYGWTDKNFRPKYDIKPTRAECAFQNNRSIIDLKSALEEAGVTLDLSDNTQALTMFQSSYIKYYPVIDFRKAVNASYAFGSNAHVVSIEKLLVSTTTPFNNMFHSAYDLESLIVEGTIGKDGFDVHYSTKLSRASVLSILLALNIQVTDVTVMLPQYFIDGETDTEATIQSDEELKAAYDAAITNGYTINFLPI